MRNKWILFLFLLGVSFISIGIFLNNKSPQVLVSKTQEVSILPSPLTLPSNIQVSTIEIQKNLVKVAKVIDGDTIQVFMNGKTETIRLIGIDTPETVDPRKPVQCFGKEASTKAKEILAGKNVSLESDPTQGDKDKYGRLLRFVFLENGTNFNELLIKEGYAHEYTYNSNPYKYQTEFIASEKSAREQNLGLWSPSACSQDWVSPIPAKEAIGPAPDGKYVCDCDKLCSQIKTCDEAYYQLNNCGCTKRDADSDGVPCESLCK